MDKIVITQGQLEDFKAFLEDNYEKLPETAGPWFQDGPSSLAVRQGKVVAMRSCGRGSYTPVPLEILPNDFEEEEDSDFD